MNIDIKILSRKDIDTTHWNLCVEKSPISFPYNYSWYLDAACDNWKGVVLGNYEAVFPLPFKTKIQVPYLYEPPFIQRLSLSNSREIPIEFIRKIEQKITSNFPFVRICTDSFFQELEKKEIKKNYTLDLNHSYNSIFEKYNTQLKKNLQTAQKNNIEIREISIEQAISFYKENTLEKVPNKQKNSIEIALEKIVLEAAKKDAIYTKGAFYENTLISSILFIKTKNRYTNLFPAASEMGRKKQGMAALLDHFIQTHTETNTILDFEGSMIEGVALFYKSFGAVEDNYWFVSKNSLPWYINPFAL